MINRSLGASLMEQAPTALRVLDQLRRENLYRNITAEFLVPRLPDNTHPALTDLLDEAVVG